MKRNPMIVLVLVMAIIIILVVLVSRALPAFAHTSVQAASHPAAFDPIGTLRTIGLWVLGLVGGPIVLMVGYRLYDQLFQDHHARKHDSEQTKLITLQRTQAEKEQEHRHWLETQTLLHKQQLETEKLELEREKVKLEREKLYLTTGLEREKILIPEGNTLVREEAPGQYKVFANPRNFKQIAAAQAGQDVEAATGLSLPYPDAVDFATILAGGWRPSPAEIFMFLTSKGAIYDVMENTCHIALAGPTGGGKTTLLRLLLAQFLYCGADIWLANPNFAPVKLNGRTIEDWRPIVNAMKRPVARKIETIKGTVESTLDYLDDLRDAQQASPLRGSDVYLALGEWIAIQSRWKDAAEPVGMLLRESRQYGIHVISELQDALVKSSGLSSGLRESFRNAYYFGGDPTTARSLLDLPQGNKIPIEETTLGKKGTALFRGNQSNGAVRGRVPFLSNRALYMLLGEPANPLPDRLPEGADPVAFFRAYGLEVPPMPGSQGTPNSTRMYTGLGNLPEGATAAKNGQKSLNGGPTTGPLIDGTKTLVDAQEGTSDSLPETFRPGPDDSVLSELQIQLFIAHYEDCGSIEKSLARIKNDKGQGLGGRYFKHASWIVKDRKLRKR